MTGEAGRRAGAAPSAEAAPRTRSRVGTRHPTYQTPTIPAATTVARAAGASSPTAALRETAITIIAIAVTLALRGIPRPARYSRTSGPTLGRPRTHCSKRGLDLAKQEAASTKNPVVGSPGTTTPRAPSATATHPSAIQPQRATPRAGGDAAGPAAGVTP